MFDSLIFSLVNIRKQHRDCLSVFFTFIPLKCFPHSDLDSFIVRFIVVKPNFFARHEHRVRQSAKLFLQSSELGLPIPRPHPTPSYAGECVPPPTLGSGGGTLARGRGGGGSHFGRGDTGTDTVVGTYILCSDSQWFGWAEPLCYPRW